MRWIKTLACWLFGHNVDRFVFCRRCGRTLPGALEAHGCDLDYLDYRDRGGDGW